MENIRCIHCGSDMVISDYDYNQGIMYYECQECGTEFNEKQITSCDECGEQIIEGEGIYSDGMIFCSDECINKYNEESKFKS